MVEIYTDGSYSVQTHSGGWSAILVKDGKAVEFHHKELKNITSSNRAELFGLLKGLEIAQKEKEVTIFSDCMYIVNGYKSWVEEWKQKGWKKLNNKQVKNSDLWQKVYALKKDHIKVKFVRSHSGNEFNDLADALATY